MGAERDVTAVGAGRRRGARTVPLAAPGCDAHPRRRPRLAVVDEDVGGVVRVTADEVGGVGEERHVPAVCADRRPGAPGLTRRVDPVTASRADARRTPFVSAATSVDALDAKAA